MASHSEDVSGAMTELKISLSVSPADEERSGMESWSNGELRRLAEGLGSLGDDRLLGQLAARINARTAYRRMPRMKRKPKSNNDIDRILTECRRLNGIDPSLKRTMKESNFSAATTITFSGARRSHRVMGGKELWHGEANLRHWQEAASSMLLASSISEDQSRLLRDAYSNLSKEALGYSSETPKVKTDGKGKARAANFPQIQHYLGALVKGGSELPPALPPLEAAVLVQALQDVYKEVDGEEMRGLMRHGEEHIRETAGVLTKDNIKPPEKPQLPGLDDQDHSLNPLGLPV